MPPSRSTACRRAQCRRDRGRSATPRRAAVELHCSRRGSHPTPRTVQGSPSGRELGKTKPTAKPHSARLLVNRPRSAPCHRDGRPTSLHRAAQSRPHRNRSLTLPTHPRPPGIGLSNLPNHNALLCRTWVVRPPRRVACADCFPHPSNAHATISGNSSRQNAPPCDPTRSSSTTSAPASRNACPHRVAFSRKNGSWRPATR